ncbi:MAG: hypothetical protein J5367_07005 [Lachnospiraceae bacterium]|nr:hypothetical protein [Lachnospiraceae bacterium]
MKWNSFVKRILTCALAAATIATAVPAYVYAEEEVVEEIVAEEEEKTEDAENTVVVGVSDRLDDYASFEQGEGFTGEKVDGREVVSANGFTFTIIDKDTTDDYKPFASLLSQILTPTSIEGAVYSYTVTAENIENASVYGNKGKEYRILRVGAADRILTLDKASDAKSVVMVAYKENGKELNGPVDVYAGTSEFSFRSGNHVVIPGFGTPTTDHPNGGGFFRATVGDKKFYGDLWWDNNYVLIDLETIEDSADVLLEETGLRKDAISASGTIEGDYEITTEVVSGNSGDYVTNSKEYDKAKVKLTVEDTGFAAYKIASMDATIKYGDKTQATTLIKDNKGIYCEIPSDILAEAAFLDKPSIVIMPKVEAEELKSISAKGFKYDKSKMANTVTQFAGDIKDYQLSVNPKTCHLSGLDAKVTVGGEYADASVVKDAKDNYYLRVSTFKDDTIASSQIWVEIVDKKNPDISYGDPFVITPEVAKKLPAPTVKVIETTDMSVTLSLAVPKAAEEYSRLWFVIEGKANVPKNKQIAEGMIEKIEPTYVPADESSHFIRLLKDESKDLGDGHAQKYDFEVKLVRGTINNPAIESPVKKISVSTKEPAYETKLGLNKKQVSFICGEGGDDGILLATAKYSKNTTFRSLAYAEITNSAGETVRSSDNEDDSKKIIIDGDSIILEDSALTPGKYKLSVLPVSKVGSPLPKAATLALTVKQGIDELTVSVPQSSYVKKAKKALTIKPTVTYNGGEKTKKPANTKLNWEVLDADGNALTAASPLYGKVTINQKKGTVTVAKDLVVSGDASAYRFMIMATAADYADNMTSAKTDVIELTAEETKPNTKGPELVLDTQHSAENGIAVEKSDLVIDGVEESGGKMYVTGGEIRVRITKEGIGNNWNAGIGVKPGDGFIGAERKGEYACFSADVVSEKMKKAKTFILYFY